MVQYGEDLDEGNNPKVMNFNFLTVSENIFHKCITVLLFPPNFNYEQFIPNFKRNYITRYTESPTLTSLGIATKKNHSAKQSKLQNSHFIQRICIRY